MTKREYPAQPLVGVGGVVIWHDRVLLVRRDTQPARGEWTIPGGLLETGETLAEGVVRELREETGVTVRVVELIEALERIFYDYGREEPAREYEETEPTLELLIEGAGEPASGAASGVTQKSDEGGKRAESGVVREEMTGATGAATARRRPKYHYVILDYLCELIEGEPAALEEISEVAWVGEQEMKRYNLTPAATRVLRKGFAMARNRSPKLAKQ
jgi:ADP-ribose pyrophosphatase YjhB (NUDIX family)